MMVFKAFKAILPNEKHFGEVPVLNPHIYPQDNYSDKSFFQLMEKDGRSAQQAFKQLIARDVLVHEKESGFYIYQQENNSKTYTGVIGLCSIEDVEQGKILPHEKTIPKREKQFLKYLKANPIQAEPVCLISENDLLNGYILKNTKLAPLHTFERNNTIHRFWKTQATEELTKIFINTNQLFIADGHHRLNSVVQYGDKINSNAQNLLSFVIPKSAIGIFSYHREIDLTELEIKTVLNYLINNNFSITAEAPTKLPENQVLIHFQNKLYLKEYPIDLLVLEEINTDFIAKTLTLNQSKRVKFIAGEKPISELLSPKDFNSLQVFLPTVSLEQIKTFSENHRFFPPKSTWILPKIPTGMCIYEM